LRRAHLQHQLTAEGAGPIDDLGAHRFISRIGGAGRHAGARLHAQRVTLALELLGRLGGDGNAGLARHRLERHADQHGELLTGLVQSARFATLGPRAAAGL
jgi:hypothetical protein